MYNAYCSYKNCEYADIIPVAFAGERCPSCGKPLSWAGTQEVVTEETLPDGKKTKKKTVIRRAPIGKWK